MQVVKIKTVARTNKRFFMIDFQQIIWWLQLIVINSDLLNRLQEYIKFQMNTAEINQLIQPFQIFYDQPSKKNYYFNTQTSQSVWQLPKELHLRVQTYLTTLKPKAQPRLNIYKHIPKEFFKKEKNKYLTFHDTKERPARKQVQTSLANNYTYKQGDQQYNFWYSKFICAKDQKQKQAALTRCDPELDVGYTAADLFNQKGGAYFCVFFARGCCANGVNCKFYHRIPSIQQCQLIDQSKDIFGRARFSTFREDMKGVGSFSKQTRAIYVSDYKLPNNENGVTQMYQILLRHFSLWGNIEDINILPHKGYAFIKYEHRSMTEFAKQAMSNQALDSNEIVTIRWANDDPNPRVNENVQKEERSLLLSAMGKKKKEKEREQKRKNLKDKRQKVVASMMKNFRKQ